MWDFTPGTDYLTLTSGPANEPPCTFAAWVMGDSPKSSPEAIISVSDAGADTNALELTAVKATGGGQPKFQFGAREGIHQALTSATFSKNTLHHVCGVFKSHSSRTIYVNGANAVTQGSTEGVSGGAVTRVARNPAATRQFNGKIGEVALWDTDLTAQEVEALFDGMPAQQSHSSNLKLFVPIRGSVGAKAFDYASFSKRHMTIVGAPAEWTEDVAPVAEPWGLQVPLLRVVAATDAVPDRVMHQGLEVGPSVLHQGLGL